MIDIVHSDTGSRLAFRAVFGKGTLRVQAYIIEGKPYINLRDEDTPRDEMGPILLGFENEDGVAVLEGVLKEIRKHFHSDASTE